MKRKVLFRVTFQLISSLILLAAAWLILNWTKSEMQRAGWIDPDYEIVEVGGALGVRNNLPTGDDASDDESEENVLESLEDKGKLATIVLSSEKGGIEFAFLEYEDIRSLRLSAGNKQIFIQTGEKIPGICWESASSVECLNLITSEPMDMMFGSMGYELFGHAGVFLRLVEGWLPMPEWTEENLLQGQSREDLTLRANRLFQLFFPPKEEKNPKKPQLNPLPPVHPRYERVVPV